MNDPQSQPDISQILSGVGPDGRVAPPWFQLFVLLVIMFGCLILGGLATYGMLHFSDSSYEAVTGGEPGTLGTLRWLLFFNQLFAFALPGVLTALYLYRRSWKQEMDLDRTPAWGLLLLASVLMLTGMPLAQLLMQWNQALPLPQWAGTMEDRSNGLIANMLEMNTPLDFVVSLLIMAVLPAIGEELIFRGFLQKNLQRWFRDRRGHLAVWVGAAIFSAIHFQFQGFLPRMFLGLVMGYLYLWSKNLWVPMLVHFINNALMVVVSYVASEKISDTLENLEKTGTESVSAASSVVFLVPFLGIGYLIYNRYGRKRDVLSEA